MYENKVLLTAEEASREFFKGKRSAWCLLRDAKRKELPSMKIGHRVFFEVHSLNNYIEKQLQKSISVEVSEFDGIYKID